MRLVQATLQACSHSSRGLLWARSFNTAVNSATDTKKAPRIKKKLQQITVVDAPLKHYKPTTPSLRHTVLIDKTRLWKGRPIKALTIRIKKHGGRNCFGRITVRHRGGGAKRIYRHVDFRRSIFDQPAVVQRFEYDPNRSAFIALVAYPDQSLSYIIAPQGLKVGDPVTSSRTQDLDVKPGNCMPLKNIPIGTKFHNMELIPGKGGKFAKSAGASCFIMDKRGKPGYALVSVTSKEQRYVPLECMGTIGEVSNPNWHLQKLGKAGRNRWLGWRPEVRGCAMNPVDHPNGGGNGKTRGCQPRSPSGILAKGGWKTVRKKRKHPLIVVRRGGTKKG